jgi:hypothetical protein
VAAPAAISVWLWFRHERKAAIRFSLAVGLTTAAGYLGLDYWSEGGFFAAAIYANVLPWWPRVLADYLRRILALYPWILAAGLVYALDRVRSRKPDLLLFYMLAAWAMAISAGHTGAALNYFIIPLAATTVCAGAVVSRVLTTASSAVAALVLVGLALQVAWFARVDSSAVAGWFKRSPEWGYAPSSEDALRARALEVTVQEIGGPILSEDPVISLRMGQDVFAAPSSSLSALDRFGDWNTGKQSLVRDISAQCFHAIVLTRADYPAEMLDAMRRSYRQAAPVANEVTGHRVFLPDRDPGINRSDQRAECFLP